MAIEKSENPIKLDAYLIHTFMANFYRINILSFSFFIISLSFSFSQSSPSDPVPMPIDSVTGAIQFQEVISIEGVNDPKILMKRARSCVMLMYSSEKDAIQQYDEVGGVLIVKGQFPIERTLHYRFMGFKTTTAVREIHYILTIEAKPGRYRVTMNKFEEQSGSNSTTQVVTTIPTNTVGTRVGSTPTPVPTYLPTTVIVNQGSQSNPIEANLGTQSEEQYVEEVRKKNAEEVKFAEKNAKTIVSSNRRYVAAIKKQCLDTLFNLKRALQKKEDKEW